MSKSLRAKAFILLAAILSFPFTSEGAKSQFYALLISASDPQNQTLLMEFKVNDQIQFYALGDNALDTPIRKKQYERLPVIPFPDVYSFTITGDRMKVVTRSRGETSGLPMKFKAWPRRNPKTLAPAQMVKGILLTGKDANNRRKHRSTLQPGTTVFVYPARPTEDSIAYAVTQVKNTQPAYEEFAEKYPDSSHVVGARKFLGAAYLRHAEERFGRYQAALQEKTAGFAQLAEARSWFDRIQPLNTKVLGAIPFAKRLTGRETELQTKFHRARELMEAAEFTKAVDTFAPIEHFRPEYPDLDTELNTIRDAAAAHYLRRAETLNNQEKFDDALEQVKRAETWKADGAILPMRNKIAENRTAYEQRVEINNALEATNAAMRAKNFLGAFVALRPVALRYPADKDLQERLLAVQQTLRTDLLARSEEIEATYTPIKPGDIAGETQVLNHYRGLAGLAEINRNDADVIFWRDTLGDYLATYYHRRAKNMVPANDPNPGALAYAFLHQAYTLALDGTKGKIEELPRWQPQVENNLRLRLDLTVQDSTPELNALAVASQLRRLIAIGMQKADLPHLEILGARRDGTPPPGGNVLELRLDLSRSSVSDTSQNESVRSEYGAGTRQILNPGWQQAKAEHDNATEKYNQLRARSTQRMKKQQRETHQRALREALAAMNAGKQTLDITPVYVQKEDVRSYQFSRNKITRTAVIELTYQWINQGVVLDTDIVRRQESAEGVEITGVERDDKNDHRNQAANLPDQATMRGRVLRALQDLLAERFIAYLDTFIAQDQTRGRQLAQQNSPLRAAEYYFRYLFNSRPTDPQRREAIEFLEKQFNLVTLDNWLALNTKATVNQASRP